MVILYNKVDILLKYAINRESFVGLNFRIIHSTWIFAVILLQYKTRVLIIL